MKVTNFTRSCLEFRREQRDLKAKGYRIHETDWEIHRGHMIGQKISDVKISCCGLYVYTKLTPQHKEIDCE